MAASTAMDRRPKDSFKELFFIASGLACLTCFSILFYINSTSRLLNHPKIPHRSHLSIKPPLQFYSIVDHLPAEVFSPAARLNISYHEEEEFTESMPANVVDNNGSAVRLYQEEPNETMIPKPAAAEAAAGDTFSSFGDQNRRPNEDLPEGNAKEVLDTYHDRDLFMKEYKEMNRSLKIFIYPPRPNDPFADLMLPEKMEPGGNYASESYFKKNLFKSHFITKNPDEADLFYLPFSMATLRHDKRIGVKGIPRFVRDYIFNISHDYPYWNRTGGADHFYVACHSIGRTAMVEAEEVKINAIQVVCSSSYFLAGYVPHKDASIPQIWPRKGKPPTRKPSDRKRLAFYAGAMNSKERKFLVQVWENDDEISVHKSRIKTPYSESLLGSKFCLHAKGFEVNTARVGDALYYGCVPVILADHYELPFSDILNWDSFSVVMLSTDIPMLKKILAEEVSSENYLRLQSNVMEVQKHFQWHRDPFDYDAFYMAMYELWLRRSHLRLGIIN